MASVALFTAIGTTGTALAAAGSVWDWAYQDAEQAVIDKRPVVAEQLRQHGGDYEQAFVTAFAEVSQNYEQAFKQGVNDGVSGRPAAQPTGRVCQVAYQRGYERGVQLRGPIHESAPQGSPALPDSSPDERHEDESTAPEDIKDEQDEADYPTQRPTVDQAKFIKRIAKSAQRVGMENDLYPSVIIAQAALESNWGASDLAQEPYHNLFGVKGNYNGQSVCQPTTEYTKAGKEVRLNDNFRWYRNDYQALCDYAKTLADPLYEGVHRTHATSYRAATHALLGKYATDPHYDRKLNRVIAGYQLTKYDRQPTDDQGKTVTHKTILAAGQVAHPKPAASSTSKPVHRLTWLSILGGVGSAGALGLLRRFIIIK